MTEVLEHNIIINDTYNDVSKFSLSVKREPDNYMEKVNSYLDRINRINTYLKERTDKINNINERLEKITWFNELDDESLAQINSIISLIKDVHSYLARIYATYNDIRDSGIKKDAIKDFKNAIDDFRETSNDLESAFFNLPKIKGFNETAQKLAEI